MKFFDFRGTKFTRLTGQDGKPWWVTKELCDYLELKNSRHAVKALPDDWKKKIMIIFSSASCSCPDAISAVREIIA